MIGWIPDRTKPQCGKRNCHPGDKVEIAKTPVANQQSIKIKTKEEQSQGPVSPLPTEHVEKAKPKKTKREIITKIIRIVLSMAWFGFWFFPLILEGNFNKLWELLTNIKFMASIIFLYFVFYIGIHKIR